MKQERFDETAAAIGKIISDASIVDEPTKPMRMESSWSLWKLPGVFGLMAVAGFGVAILVLLMLLSIQEVVLR